jgi:hypothetical protein
MAHVNKSNLSNSMMSAGVAHRRKVAAAAAEMIDVGNENAIAAFATESVDVDPFVLATRAIDFFANVVLKSSKGHRIHHILTSSAIYLFGSTICLEKDISFFPCYTKTSFPLQEANEAKIKATRACNMIAALSQFNVGFADRTLLKVF